MWTDRIYEYDIHLNNIEDYVMYLREVTASLKLYDKDDSDSTRYQYPGDDRYANILTNSSNEIENVISKEDAEDAASETKTDCGNKNDVIPVTENVSVSSEKSLLEQNLINCDDRSGVSTQIDGETRHDIVDRLASSSFPSQMENKNSRLDVSNTSYSKLSDDIDHVNLSKNMDSISCSMTSIGGSSNDVVNPLCKSYEDCYSCLPRYDRIHASAGLLSKSYQNLTSNINTRGKLNHSFNDLSEVSTTKSIRQIIDEAINSTLETTNKLISEINLNKFDKKTNDTMELCVGKDALNEKERTETETSKSEQILTQRFKIDDMPLKVMLQITSYLDDVSLLNLRNICSVMTDALTVEMDCLYKSILNGIFEMRKILSNHFSKFPPEVFSIPIASHYIRSKYVQVTKLIDRIENKLNKKKSFLDKKKFNADCKQFPQLWYSLKSLNQLIIDLCKSFEINKI